MHNNLTPQKRLDKNGRLVTKHVRVQASPNGALSIPKVFGVKAEMGVMGKWGETNDQYVTDMFRSMNQHTLLSIRDIMVDCDERSKEQLQKIILDRSYSSVRNGTKEVESDLHYAALLLPLLNAIHADRGGFSIGNAGRVEEYIPQVLGDRVPPMILHGTEREQNLVKGYCMMVQAGYESGPDHEDMEWFGEHSEELVPHFDRLKQLDDLDRELCESIINNDSPSMSSGVL